MRMTFGTGVQYIVTTMGSTGRYAKARSLLIILTIIMLCAPAYAKAGIRDGFGADLGIGWYGSIPSAFHEDPLPIRTHLTVGGTLSPAAFRFGESHELSAGISGYYTTRSLIYGVTVFRPFAALGATLDYTYHMDDRLSLIFGITMFAAVYPQTLDFHPLLRTTITGSYAINPNDRNNRWFLTLPFSVDLRSDYVSITAGLGMRWRYDRPRKEGIE